MEEGFKKGDYIVILRPKPIDSSFIKHGHCYKQGSDDTSFNTKKDSRDQGCSTNITFERTHWWRYATKAEIAEYEREDKPFDTTEFTPVVTDNYEIY